MAANQQAGMNKSRRRTRNPTLVDAEATTNGKEIEGILTEETIMVVKVMAAEVVAQAEEATVRTTTVTITTMVEEALATMEAVEAKDTMDATTSTNQTHNTFRPTSNNQCSNQCINRIPYPVDNSSRTTWTAMPTSLAMAMVANGATSNINDCDRPHLVQKASS